MQLLWGTNREWLVSGTQEVLCLLEILATIREINKLPFSTPLTLPGMTKSVDEHTHPNHYTWHPKVEAYEVAEHLTYNLGTALVYIWRCGRKDDPLKDIAKAIRHLEFERDRLIHSSQASDGTGLVASPEHYDDKYDK